MHLVLASGFNTSLFFQQVENGIVIGAIYALISLGYTLVYGIIELINFAHGDVFMWSTIVTLAVAQSMGLDKLTSPLSIIPLVGVLVLLLVIGALTSAAINVTIERFAYRPLRKAPRLLPLISAIGVSFVLQNLAQLWRGAAGTAYPAFFPTTGIQIGSFTLETLDIFIVVLAVGLMIGLNRFINTTKLGRAMRATAQDPEAAQLMGVNINRTIATTFLIGGALAGAAGVIYSMKFNFVRVDIGLPVGLTAFTAAVLGGIGNPTGAMLGGFLIGLIEALVTQYVPNGLAWSDAFVFGILIMILVFRPSGLLGQQVPDKV
ncbi:MAG: branched-chain amino acid ABC transporter permease [Ktedonobacterales bacterium]|nr:branched-chain amino acid ABC transporter permease [Ktedonobacterales bacterium]